MVLLLLLFDSLVRSHSLAHAHVHRHIGSLWLDIAWKFIAYWARVSGWMCLELNLARERQRKCAIVTFVAVVVGVRFVSYRSVIFLSFNRWVFANKYKQFEVKNCTNNAHIAVLLKRLLSTRSRHLDDAKAIIMPKKLVSVWIYNGSSQKIKNK